MNKNDRASNQDHRVPELGAVVLAQSHAEAYDKMQGELWQNKWLETDDLLKAGLQDGPALELGSGPGFLGLDWLRQTDGTQLTGLDLSPHMVEIARAHASEYGFLDRAEYVVGCASKLPFRDGVFASVFSSRSLHEWSAPREGIAELWRVLRCGGRLYLSDLRRDIAFSARRFLERRMPTPETQDGLRASLAASYTKPELTEILACTPLSAFRVVETHLGLHITGQKNCGSSG